MLVTMCNFFCTTDSQNVFPRGDFPSKKLVNSLLASVTRCIKEKIVQISSILYPVYVACFWMVKLICRRKLLFNGMKNKVL
ncbi:hypothetical protein FO014_08960 [Serratia rhizosphaerae]|uniref:Uncharacterized protein n=1 Tax=Serratia rhizosphaerae TaxID=2597702 RepID=A0ABX6GLF7_9GAMM|nr:hypothetical protein FO014_08960 [Serratia rhizosphaerae]